MKTRKCTKCGKLKPLSAFYRDKYKKTGLTSSCKVCKKKTDHHFLNTERGYLHRCYQNMTHNTSRKNNWRNKCYFTLNDLCAAFKKHKSTHGMKSAWGPGIDHLDQHLPITMISKGDSSWSRGEGKRTASNLSVDRLDSNLDYTLQNIIFIRTDENRRKSDSSYEDCKIHMRLHEERFIKMKAI